MNKHTPGPWFIEESYHTSINNGPADKPHKHIAMVNFYNCHDVNQRVDEQEHQANVHLIAMAPELLQTLEDLVDAIESVKRANMFEYHPESHTGRMVSNALSVIAKAKGEK